MSKRPALSQRIANSAYLSRLANLDAVSEIGDVENTDADELLKTIIDEVNNFRVKDGSDQIKPSDETQSFLITAKSKFAFAWSVAQLNQSIEFADLGKYQSLFSDATIDCALRAAWYSDGLTQIHKHLPKDSDSVPGLFVLGLGKLGGLDLNFSSDVDLVAYYCDKTLPIPKAIGQGYIVNKVLQKLTNILTNDNKVDFIWRVDWRLRPEASSSLLTMSTDAAKEFYFYRALPWHRLAMMKARVVAGEIPLGQEFLEELQRFVWRQNLDLRAIDELAHMKKRINLEHPGLKHQRTQREPIEKECAGFNVKLGSGGIREIEFIINGLQLLWGGKKPSMQITNTLEALSILSEYGYLDEVDALVLSNSYCFFRDLENHIQILNNAQTHIVPTEVRLQEQLIGLRQSADHAKEFSIAWQNLCVKVFKHRSQINLLFEEFFQAETASQLDAYELPDDWEEVLDDRSKAVIENWTTGFTQYGVPNIMAVSLEPLSQQLLSAVFEDSGNIDINQHLISIDNFLGSLRNTTQYFRLLASYPNLVESIVPPLLYSPHMGKLLKQSPHIIDNLIAPEDSAGILSRIQRYEEQASSVFVSRDYGIRLESIRRYVNENLYESYLAFMQGQLPVKMFQLSLTRLAECTLSASIEIARQELQLDELPLVVLGMGKLAMSRMSPLSDLDLVFIFADGFDLDTAQKVVSRLQTILGMELKEGIAYELDTRLRPSGRSGPPTVFLKGFREHHMQRAKNWEHIALLPSRIVAGDPELAKAVIQIKHDIFKKQRDQKQWFIDAKKMWQRVADQRIKEVDASVVSSKLRRGGLMQAEYLAVCFCIDQLSKMDFYQSNKKHIDRFSYLLKAAQTNHKFDIDLDHAIEFWSTVQIWERLLGLEDGSYEDMPEHLQQIMLQQLGCASMKDFYAQAEKISQQVEHVMQIYFSECPLQENELEEWQEKNVSWI